MKYPIINESVIKKFIQVNPIVSSCIIIHSNVGLRSNCKIPAVNMKMSQGVGSLIPSRVTLEDFMNGLHT